MTPADRLLSKVHFIPESGCWIFAGRWNRDGYGMFHLDGRTIYAHRAAWAIFKGRVPRNREIDHLCNLRSCCNPAHLEAVTRCTNMHRIYKRRAGGFHHA